ncbi:MAG: hypothetical protein JWO74_4824 [Solirubrobacterales bacterium]|nr:hypothetical protein [Solirubrobacterales bacterium]
MHADDDETTERGSAEPLWADGPAGASAAPAQGEDPPSTKDEHALPTKVCPKCSVAERTRGAFCAHCGASYDRAAARRRRPRPSRRVTLTLLAVVILLAGGGVAAAMIVQHNNDQKAQRAHEAVLRRRAQERHLEALAKAAADRAAAAARRGKEEQDAATRGVRRSLVNDLRKAITKDARQRVDEGLLDGPIYGTQCDPIGGGNASNLDARTGRYSCLAYNKKNNDGTISGYGFMATVNFEKFTYQWHLGNS